MNSVNISFQARVGNSIPGLIHRACDKHQTSIGSCLLFLFLIPYGVVISKRSTEIIT